MKAFLGTAVAVALAAGVLQPSQARSETLITGSIGPDHGNLGVATEGLLGLSANWTRSDDADQVFGVGFGPTLPLGPLRIGAQAKALYLDIGGGSSRLRDGIGGAVQGNVSLSLGPLVEVFASAAYAPSDLLPSRAHEYRMATAGVSIQILDPLRIQAGYRYEVVEGAGFRRNVRLADDFFVGAVLKF
jgi:hypothetical protein